MFLVSWYANKDFLWRLELPLSTWGAVFQGFTTSLLPPQCDSNNDQPILLMRLWVANQLYLLGEWSRATLFSAISGRGL